MLHEDAHGLCMLGGWEGIIQSRFSLADAEVTLAHDRRCVITRRAFQKLWHTSAAITRGVSTVAIISPGGDVHMPPRERERESERAPINNNTVLRAAFGGSSSELRPQRERGTEDFLPLAPQRVVVLSIHSLFDAIAEVSGSTDTTQRRLEWEDI
ncbi:unnamed protein product [Pleuronectes platessa]|uniref:Uncharacterized protein n=1 Tax=Pleuronectes platessa TaxID=8262 RepID=A0A9N7TPH2_PLEPL|nr:unnamed protein product [Pleuronectes platessa]